MAEGAVLKAFSESIACDPMLLGPNAGSLDDSSSFRSVAEDAALGDTEDMFEANHSLKTGVYGVLYTVSKVTIVIPRGSYPISNPTSSRMCLTMVRMYASKHQSIYG